MSVWVGEKRRGKLTSEVYEATGMTGGFVITVNPRGVKVSFSVVSWERMERVDQPSRWDRFTHDELKWIYGAFREIEITTSNSLSDDENRLMNELRVEMQTRKVSQ